MIGRGVRSNRKSTLAQGADVPSGPSRGPPACVSHAGDERDSDPKEMP